MFRRTSSRSRGVLGATVLMVVGLAAPPAMSAQAAEPGPSSWLVKGVTLVPQSAEDFSSATTRATIDRLKADGVNYVGLTYPIYQSTVRSADIAPGADTPSIASLRSAMGYAHSVGLKVMIKPHFEERGARWRYFLSPDNRDLWFDRVQGIQTQLAALKPDALVMGTEMFCTTTDLYDARYTRDCGGAPPQVTNGTYWTRIINAVRGTGYTGLLTYDAQDEAPAITFWGLLDVIAVSGYDELLVNNPSCDVTVDQLKDEWRRLEADRYLPLVQKFNKRLMFLELGYSSSYCNHKHPWEYSGHSGKPDPAEQDKLYEAFFQFWGTRSYMEGVNWWNWRSDPAFGGLSNSDYTTRDKPAEATMRRYFGAPVNAAPSPTAAPTATATPSPTAVPTPSPGATGAAPTGGTGGSTAQSTGSTSAPNPGSPTPAVSPAPLSSPSPTAAPITTPSARPSATPAVTPTATRVVPSSTRVVNPRVRIRQRISVRLANYKPGTRATVSQRYRVAQRVNGNIRVTVRTVSLAAVRVPASGAVTVSVLPAQAARAGWLDVRGTGRNGKATSYTAVIRVG